MKKISLASIPFLALTFLVSCNNATEYKVSIPDTNGVIVTPAKAVKGKEYVGTISIATDMIDKQVLPEALDKVTSGNKALQPTEYTYTLKEDKVSADFKIPAANIVGDVAIQLTLEDKPGPTPVDPYKVTEDEFNNACSFVGVQYLQLNLNNETESITLLEELSPSVYHFVNEGNSQYHEEFVKKEGGSYEKAAREAEKGNFEFTEASEEDFVTPQSEKINVAARLKHAGLSYSSFTYDETNKTYTATDEGSEERAKTTVTLKFENKILISKKDVIEDKNGNITEAITYTYEKKTPEYPEKTADSTVTQDEFNDACSFKSVQYVQSYLEDVFQAGYTSNLEELSPTVYRSVYEDSKSGYNEKLVKKDGDSYEQATRNAEEGDFEFNDATVDDFVTPQSESFKVSTTLEHAELSYSSFTYNPKEGVYSATNTPKGGRETTTTLKFENKVLMSMVQETEGSTITTTYTYVEKTPTYPEKPADPTVTKDEFTTALAFEGVEYLQEENNSVYSESTKQISPSTYYERSTVMSFLTEQYVYKLKEDIYKKIMRNDSTTDWKNINWESATEQELCTPQMVGKSISDILSTYNVEEFDPEKYDSTTQSYVLSGDSYDFSFKFENKKLVQFGDADGQMTYTYTYEEKTPELPIDPPKPPEPGQEYTLTFYESDGQTVYTTVTITSDNPTFVVPNHGEDEGTWEFKVGVIQGLTPGSQVTIPAEDLDDYDLVWTPQTNSVPLSI